MGYPYALAPLARLELPSRASRAPRTSLSRASNFPLARLATSLSRASRLEWDFQIAARKASGRMGGAPRGVEGGGSRGEAALAVPTRRREWEARHYRARATSCGVPSYLEFSGLRSRNTSFQNSAFGTYEGFRGVKGYYEGLKNLFKPL
jgi:hypothetical protein